MNDEKVRFCYYDLQDSSYVEVYGHISPMDYRIFVNELYSLRLDSIYSQKQYLKPFYSTGTLINSLKPEEGVVDLSEMRSMLRVENFDDNRTKRILESYFSSIQIDGITKYTSDVFKALVRENSSSMSQLLSSPSFEREIHSIDANTRAVRCTGYNFMVAKRLQDSLTYPLEDYEIAKPKINVKVS